MKILFIGEASYVHNTLQRELRAMGHTVTLMSDGNDWHNSPRDIDLGRDMKEGLWGGVKVMWRLLRSLPKLRGYDVVQITNPNCIPLRVRWTMVLLNWLCRQGAKLVMGCWGDDTQVIERQLQGALEYSDIYWDGKPQMQAENALRITANLNTEISRAHKHATRLAVCLVPCLYEYYVIYDVQPYNTKLHYLPLPITLPKAEEVRTKGTTFPIRVLVAIQSKRDYMKGARRIASWLEEIAAEEPEKLIVDYAEDVPYEAYCSMLDKTDVLVDQLYSYTPAMNALAAMARGTVVIGGGEEEYYRFIGEETLRPIINVRPDKNTESQETLRRELLTPGRVAKLSRESRAFVEKHHDARRVAEKYSKLYEQLVDSKR